MIYGLISKIDQNFQDLGWWLVCTLYKYEIIVLCTQN